MKEFFGLARAKQEKCEQTYWPKKQRKNQTRDNQVMRHAILLAVAQFPASNE